MTERQLQDAIITICRFLRVKVYHTFDSRRSEAGFPDLVIAGPSGLMFRELKTTTGRVSTAQREWLDALTWAGADAAVWRPADLPDVQAQVLARCGRGAA